jgi:Ser/Thr protein kinase RdoA (MazF antagonist)
VLASYRLPGPQRVLGEFPGTQLSLRVQAGESRYVLRRFNEYTRPSALHGQFLLADFLHRGGLRVLRPIRTREERPYAAAGDRLWALFPHCEGRPGRNDSPEDRLTAAAQQGSWVAAAERIRVAPEWELIVRLARPYRQRKSWAWVVALDRVADFAREHGVLNKLRETKTGGPALAPLEAALADFEQALAEEQVARLPRTVTHGDLHPTNLLIEQSRVTVLDLDCYSFEPRAADLARTLSPCLGRAPDAPAALVRAFQARARVAEEELAVLPLLVCAHGLYYAVGHALMFLEETAEAEQAKWLASITHGTRAISWYRRERDRVLNLLRGREA